MKYTNNKWSHGVGMTAEYRHNHDLIFSKPKSSEEIQNHFDILYMQNKKDEALAFLKKEIEVLAFKEQHDEIAALRKDLTLCPIEDYGQDLGTQIILLFIEDFKTLLTKLENEYKD